MPRTRPCVLLITAVLALRVGIVATAEQEILIPELGPEQRGRNSEGIPDNEPFPTPDAPENIDWFSEEHKEFHAAILLAGSLGYANYRHQADVCHAYTLLRRGGIPNKRIITLVYDDVADSKLNPYPGELYNRPGGPNVYSGCAKDYTGVDVNRDTLVAVLLGDAKAVKGKGSGRVLKPDPNQRVFVYYSDHGAAGVLSMPSGLPMSGLTLHDTLAYMRREGFFKELVLYLESCESGSLLEGFGYEEWNDVLAVAASRPDENSYATYCPGPDTDTVQPNPNEIGSCMGDLFSVAWMEFAETHDMGLVTIDDQLEVTIDRTKVSSDVVVYASKKNPIRQQVIGNFFSFFDVPTGLTKNDAYGEPHDNAIEIGSRNATESTYPQERGGIQQRNADLVLWQRRLRSEDVDVREAANRTLAGLLTRRRFADKAIRAIVRRLLNDGSLRDGERRGVELLATRLFSRGRGQQMVSNWTCFEKAIEVWTEHCGELDGYSSQYTRTFVNLCNDGVQDSEFQTAAIIACAT